VKTITGYPVHQCDTFAEPVTECLLITEFLQRLQLFLLETKSIYKHWFGWKNKGNIVSAMFERK